MKLQRCVMKAPSCAMASAHIQLLWLFDLLKMSFSNENGSQGKVKWGNKPKLMFQCEACKRNFRSKSSIKSHCLNYQQLKCQYLSIPRAFCVARHYSYFMVRH